MATKTNFRVRVMNFAHHIFRNSATTWTNALKNGKIMVLNDEGKFTKGIKAAATFLAHIHHSVAPRYYVAGDVVVCPSEMVK